jgi:hypothetical protein
MKTVTKTVQLFEKGDFARVKKGITMENCRHGSYQAGDILLVCRQDDDGDVHGQINPQKEGFEIDDDGEVMPDYCMHESELELLPSSEVEKIKNNIPATLKVDSLEPTIVVGRKDGKVHVGCQMLTWNDARKVGEFLLANVPVRRSKKVSKKRGRK